MCLSSTLLPVPDGPSSATVSPSRTSKSTPFSTTCLPNRLWTFAELDHWLSSSRVSTVSSTRISTELVTTARRGGLAHSLGALLGVEAHVAGDDR